MIWTSLETTEEDWRADGEVKLTWVFLETTVFMSQVHLNFATSISLHTLAVSLECNPDLYLSSDWLRERLRWHVDLDTEPPVTQEEEVTRLHTPITLHLNSTDFSPLRYMCVSVSLIFNTALLHKSFLMNNPESELFRLLISEHGRSPVSNHPCSPAPLCPQTYFPLMTLSP